MWPAARTFARELVRAFACSFVLLSMASLSDASAQSAPTIEPHPDPWSTPAPSGKKAVIFISGETTAFETAVTLPRVGYEQTWLEEKGYSIEVHHGTLESILEAMVDPEVKAFSYFGHGTGATIENLDAKDWQLQIENRLMRKFRAQGLSKQEASAKIKEFRVDKELVRNFSCYSLNDTALAKKIVKVGGSYWGSPKAVVTCPTPSQSWSGDDFLLSEYIVPGAPIVKLVGTAELRDGTAQGGTYKGHIQIKIEEGKVVDGHFVVALKDNQRKATFKGTLDADGGLTASLQGEAIPTDPLKPQDATGPLGGVSNSIGAIENLVIRTIRTFSFSGELKGKIDATSGSGAFTATGVRKPGGPITLTGTWKAAVNK